MHKKSTVSYEDHSLIPSEQVLAISEQLLPEVQRIQASKNTGYKSNYASVWLSYDQELLHKIRHVIAEKKSLNPTMLVVIGIGGSNLGTIAIHQALQGMMYNAHHPSIQLYCLDTVDTDYVAAVVQRIEQELHKNNTIIVNVVTKSGTTTETIANFEIVLACLQRYKKDTYAEHIVVTTDKDSPLWERACQEKFTCLEIPVSVGGRYSVLSAVGLFPLGLLGIDLEALCAGAGSAVVAGINPNSANNSALHSAAMLYAHYKAGITIHDTFLFALCLEGIGKWYRQLLGESIGKEYDQEGNRVCIGLTPTVSVGSTDLHSVGQLYLGGPRDKITTFVVVQEPKSSLYVPVMESFAPLAPSIQGSSLQRIMLAIVQGTQIAYQKRSLPFVSWSLSCIDAWSIGYFLQCKMLEIMYLGFLLKVNPFDQPNVESYKQETRKILLDE